MIIRESRDQLAFNQSPGLIAVFHALHRLLAPRHPPHALSSLAALIPSPIGLRQPVKRSCLKLPTPTNPCLLGKSNDPFHSQGSCRVICEATLTATELSKNKSCHDHWAGAGALANAAARTQMIPGLNAPRLTTCAPRFALLVETTGIEPATSGLQNRRSPN